MALSAKKRSESPTAFLKPLLAKRRSKTANQRLGAILAFVAGAANAGGFIAIGKYTSHMSGMTSSVADDFILRQNGLAMASLGMLAAFISGAACTALLVNWGRRSKLKSPFALPICLESLLLLLFGWISRDFSASTSSQFELGLMLCFMMGIQNALITKVANAEIRTTHVTGLVTDIGIEVGKLFYWNRSHVAGSRKIMANREKLKSHAEIFISFLGGALAGALGFKLIGYSAFYPLAGILFLLVWPHIKFFKPPKAS